MPIFANADDMWKVMGPLWERIKADPQMGPDLLQSGLIVQFRYRDPELILTIDSSDRQDMKIINGAGPNKPTIVMSMKADVAHEFWLGKVSVPVAILTGKIASVGPTAKALALLPLIRPAFPIYAQILKDRGQSTLIHK